MLRVKSLSNPIQFFPLRSDPLHFAPLLSIALHSAPFRSNPLRSPFVQSLFLPSVLIRSRLPPSKISVKPSRRKFFLGTLPRLAGREPVDFLARDGPVSAGRRPLFLRGAKLSGPRKLTQAGFGQTDPGGGFGKSNAVFRVHDPRLPPPERTSRWRPARLVTEPPCGLVEGAAPREKQGDHHDSGNGVLHRINSQSKPTATSTRSHGLIAMSAAEMVSRSSGRMGFVYQNSPRSAGRRR